MVGSDDTLALSAQIVRFESHLTVLDLARAGEIRAHVERFPLDRVEDAYEKMRAGTLDGRAVICPHG